MPEAPKKIADLFSENIRRNIEEVIKVDDLRDETLLEEIREYYPTPSIQQQMAQVLEAYAALHRGPTDRVGVWVSGFFGAGKSSFAKLLAVLLEDRKIGGQDAVELFSRRITDDRVKIFLKQIREHVRTVTVVFDILKDQIQSARDYPVTAVMYRALLRRLGYAHDIELAELEINLEQRGEVEAFKRKYAEVSGGRSWDDRKLLVMTAMNEASRVLHELDPRTYPAADTWARTRAKPEITPRKLAERAVQLAAARAGGRNVVFAVDEIGQYIARDLTRIGDLQGVIESLSLVGKGKVWLVATSQEKLEAIVDIYEKDRSDLVRLQDRFAYKVMLNPNDIREVASHRVLAKTAAAEAMLRRHFQEHRGKLAEATRVTGAVQLPPLEEDSFVQLYPLVPYQVDLLISVVSGLRRQGGGPQTMGGANRTIIKLAQQLLIHPKVGLADRPVGPLVTFDSVYELIVTNISSEIQQEIGEIERQVQHPYAGPVAKALALLQFAETVHATDENLAAVLHPGLDAVRVLPQVREAVEKLLEARKIRRTEHGLKIQSAAERTWDEERDSRRPGPAQRLKTVKEALQQIWGAGAQAPSHQLGGSKRFTAGLRVGGETLVEGDLLFEVRLTEVSRPRDEQIQEARSATQQDQSLVSWTLELSEAAERAIMERYRSEQMLSRPLRKGEEALQRDERRRLSDANEVLRDEISRCLCRGRIFFRGNDRSPDPEAKDPKAEARRVLGQALGAVFHRFADGDVRIGARDPEAILRSESLAGLPHCYAEFKLVQTVDGQVRLVTEQGAAQEIFEWILLRCDEGRAPSGREFEQHFGAAPYGWDFDLVRLVVAALLRAGRVTLTAQGQQIRNALTPEAQREIGNNPRFRALTVRVRESRLDPRRIREAAHALEDRFGERCPALAPESVAAVLRTKLCAELPRLERARDTLRDLRLPAAEVIAQGLDVLRVIKEGDDEGAIQAFLESVDVLAKAIPRGRQIEERLHERALRDLERARAAVALVGPALDRELEAADPLRAKLAQLRDRLAKETFYEELAEISSEASAALARFEEIYQAAFTERRKAYREALEALYEAAGWAQLSPAQQDDIALELRGRSQAEPEAEPWRQGASVLQLLRAEAKAAAGHLQEALAAVHRATTPEAVQISVRALLNGPITEENLESAIKTLREAIEKALADGHPVILI